MQDWAASMIQQPVGLSDQRKAGNHPPPVILLGRAPCYTIETPQARHGCPLPSDWRMPCYARVERGSRKQTGPNRFWRQQSPAWWFPPQLPGHVAARVPKVAAAAAIARTYPKATSVAEATCRPPTGTCERKLTGSWHDATLSRYAGATVA